MTHRLEIRIMLEIFLLKIAVKIFYVIGEKENGKRNLK